MIGLQTVLSRVVQCRSKFIYLIGFLFLSFDFVSAANKEIVVIVSHAGRLKCDFHSLYSPEERSLILLTTSDCRNKLRTGQEAFFTAILESSDFSAKGIVDGCVQALKITNTIDPAHLKIITLDEDITLSVGEARESLGTDGPYFSELEPFRNKLVMKQKVLAQGIRIPKHVSFQNEEYRMNPHGYLEKIALDLSFPIFAKPIDGEGSCDTCKIQNLQELDAWCHAHVNFTNYELDEFISGTLYHCDSVIQNGKMIFSGCCRYACPNAEFLSGRPLGSYTLDSSDPDYFLLKTMNERILNAMAPIPDGVTHLELFKDVSGNLIFLEIACRPPGASVPEVYEKAFDINLHEAHFKGQMGLPYTLPGKVNHPSYAAFMWFPRKQGVVSSRNDPLIDSSFSFNWIAQKGDIMEVPTDILHRVGGCLLWNDSYEILIKDFYHLFSCFEPITYLNE